MASDGKCQIPDRFESFEKYKKKALKLKEHLELELEERGQVDDVLNFFMGTGATAKPVSGHSTTSAGSLNFLDDDQFYKPMNISGSQQKAAATQHQIDSGLTQEEQEVIEQIQRNIGQSGATNYGQPHQQQPTPAAKDQ